MTIPFLKRKMYKSLNRLTNMNRNTHTSKGFSSFRNFEIRVERYVYASSPIVVMGAVRLLSTHSDIPIRRRGIQIVSFG